MTIKFKEIRRPLMYFICDLLKANNNIAKKHYLSRIVKWKLILQGDKKGAISISSS